MDNSSTRPLAVVTGASSGIGHELAKQFAQNGFDLVVTSTGPSINEAAQAFERLGASVQTVQADLATSGKISTGKRPAPEALHTVPHSINVKKGLSPFLTRNLCCCDERERTSHIQTNVHSQRTKLKNNVQTNFR